jgi:hypothetical protein
MFVFGAAPLGTVEPYTTQSSPLRSSNFLFVSYLSSVSLCDRTFFLVLKENRFFNLCGAGGKRKGNTYYLLHSGQSGGKLSFVLRLKS